MSSTSALQIASPSPVPPYLRVIEGSAWLKDSKSPSSCSSVMPMPVSVTSKRTAAASSGAFATRSCTDPGVRELDGVLEQVGQHLGDAAEVAHHGGGHVGFDRAGEDELLALGGEAHVLSHLEHHRPQIELECAHLGVARLDPGEVEQVFDQSQQSLAGTVDVVQQPGLLGRGLGLAQHLASGQHAGQRRSQLVAHVGEEQGLRHRRLFRSRAGILQLVAHPVGSGDVLGDAVHAGHLAVGDDRHPGDPEVELLAVLAPDGGLELTRLALGDVLERGPRHLGVLGCREHGGVHPLRSALEKPVRRSQAEFTSTNLPSRSREYTACGWCSKSDSLRWPPSPSPLSAKRSTSSGKCLTETSVVSHRDESEQTASGRDLQPPPYRDKCDYVAVLPTCPEHGYDESSSWRRTSSITSSTSIVAESGWIGLSVSPVSTASLTARNIGT